MLALVPLQAAAWEPEPGATVEASISAGVSVSAHFTQHFGPSPEGDPEVVETVDFELIYSDPLPECT